MGLSGALGIAQSALTNTAAQSALLSQNIANVSNTDYGRRSASTVSQIYGSVEQGTVQRAANTALLTNLLAAQSAAASQQALGDGLTSLASTLNLDATSSTGDASTADSSPSTLIGSLATALQQYAAAPDNAALATAAVAAAKTLATSLNAASANVATVRAQADSDIAASVQTINGLLTQFQSVNATIIAGTATGRDISSAQDTRDGILKQLSTQIGIATVQNANGGMSIYTDSGATLFDVTARKVGFTQTGTFLPSTVGQSVTVDGVPVTGPSAVMAIKSGALAGLTDLRDNSSVAYGNQLDQIASALITAFSESDQSGSNLPDLAGVFTAGGSSALPSSATGLAASISVNARVDPGAGGLATRLRDGNVSSAASAYGYNATGAAAYSDRLDALVSGLDASRSFNPASGGVASGSVATYAASSVSWISAQRQSATAQATSTGAVASAASTALSNATGVNLDDEMSKMLDLEHAYQASAQLMNTVNAMYSSLLSAFN